jgi:Xaa-Pro dipeptidase
MSQSRIDQLIPALKKHGLDGLALIPSPSLYYLTNLSFHLMERPVVALFMLGQRPHLILPEMERGKPESSGLDAVLHCYSESEASRTQAFQQAASALPLEGARLGVEPLRLRMYELRILEAMAPGVTFTSAEQALGELRTIKDSNELQAMRRAVAVAQQALVETLPKARVGVSERELASELVAQLLRAGSQPELPFSPIVASGPNSALPHAVPTDRRLRPGDLLLLDWGATVEGYVSDLTRTFAVEEVDPELARVHQVVLQANAAAQAAVRPGVPCSDIDRAARQLIEQAGYGEHFTHRTGHGLGLEAHEGPYIHGENPQPLAPGMTFTIEPGIYLEGRGGVRIEDDMVVTEDGCESLSDYARELQMIP